MDIGFFDSGVGGITVLKEAVKSLPCENLLYYADTAHVPYGTKPKEEVKEYIFAAADFLLECGVKIVVVACNTATSIAIRDLRERYNIPVVGMEPAVKPAVERNENTDKRVLVFATALTLKEQKFQELVARVDHEHKVDALPLPELVEFAEKLEFSEDIIIPYLNDKLSAFDISRYGTVVLGCTHFPLYKKMFRKVLPEDIDLIDGSIGTVRQMKRILEERNLLINGQTKGRIEFYTSCGNKSELDKLAKVYNYYDTD